MERLIYRSTRLRVGRLRFIIHHYNLAEYDVYERAAHHCKLAYSPIIPTSFYGYMPTQNLDRIGGITSVRGMLLDREVIFAAPEAEQMVSIGVRNGANQALFRKVCIVPVSSLRQFLVNHNSTGLISYARQQVVRFWPLASAQLELTRMARIVFVTTLCVFVAGAAFAPFQSEAFLAAFLLLIFLPGAWMRVAALLELFTTQKETALRPPLLSDIALPVYSVLIPLRDETAMVSQLGQAMRALDYPVLGSKRTK